jgi:D-lactate dehydrogenase
LTEESAERNADAEIISVFVYSRLAEDVLKKLKNLKAIATRSTGFDHIDMEFCRNSGITVCTVPSYGENTLAEHVFALPLVISHRIVEAADRTRRGDFSLGGLRGFNLTEQGAGMAENSFCHRLFRLRSHSDSGLCR